MIKKVVNGLMESLNLPYMYWEYSAGENARLYFVGERLPGPIGDEGGSESGSFVVSGWSRNGVAPLDEAEKAIKAALNAPAGDYRVSEVGVGACAVWYSHAVDVPSDVEGMCRVEYTLGYTEWAN